MLLASLGMVDQFQVLQDEPARITVRLATNAAFDRAAHEPRLLDRLAELGGEGVWFDFDYVDKVPVPPSGKRRYIISTVGHEPSP